MSFRQNGQRRIYVLIDRSTSRERELDRLTSSSCPRMSCGFNTPVESHHTSVLSRTMSNVSIVTHSKNGLAYNDH